MDRLGKSQLKEKVGTKLSTASAVIIAEFRGMKVEQLTALRVALRKSKAEFRVTKNRIYKRAIKDHAPDLELISSSLKGPVGAVVCYGDVVQSAKSLIEFAKENELFVIRNGVFDGELLDEQKLKALSDLPSKEVLMSRLLGSLMSPHRGLVTVLSGVPRNVVQVLAAIRDKKQAE
jgi:large subunit ribosomal protein L10